MWYKIAKQGSLWQRISPTFEQDVEDAIKSATVIKDFSLDDQESSNGRLKAGKKYTIDLDKFMTSFSLIPNNPLADYKFLYNPYVTSAYCDRYNKQIVIGTSYMQRVGWLRSTIKHEIIHAIEGTISYLADKFRRVGGEYYSQPDEASSILFRKYEDNQTPLGREEIEEQIYHQYLSATGGDVEYSKKMTRQTLKELDRRSSLISGDVDMYMANPSELRAFRSEIDNVFNIDNLKTVYHQIYENLENGKELYLKGFYELIQSIVNVSDVSENYMNSFYSNLLYVADVDGFDWRFNTQVIKNLDPQYVRQIAKYLSDRFIEMKSYINSYVPDTSETEVL
jgi:uncharacterized glyoxalase superfamily protein PhnB